jgi:polyisoprenoid-binding protein YceI
MKKTLIPAVLSFAFLASATALAAFSHTGAAEVSFTAAGPAGLRIVGTTKQLTVKDDGSQVVVTVPLKDLDTKIDLRNKHMREKYLEVAKYPDAVLSVPRASLKLPEGGDVSATAGGTMTLHGQSKPVTFTYKATKQANKLAVTGTVRLNIKEFGISEPSFMGATVKPDVDVAASFAVEGN